MDFADCAGMITESCHSNRPNHAGSREQILISRVLHKIDTAQCLVQPKSREGSLFPSFLLMTLVKQLVVYMYILNIYIYIHHIE